MTLSKTTRPPTRLTAIRKAMLFLSTSPADQEGAGSRRWALSAKPEMTEPILCRLGLEPVFVRFSPVISRFSSVIFGEVTN
jgi:hypothetical protein